MAFTQKNRAAFAAQKPAPMAPKKGPMPPGQPGKGAPKAPPGAMPPKKGPMGEHPEGHGAMPDEGKAEEMQEGVKEQNAVLVAKLEDYAKDIVAASEEIDAEELAMDSLSPQEEQILASGVSMIDPELVDEMKKSFPNGLVREEADELAIHLLNEGFIEEEDFEGVAGYLYHLAAYLESQ